MTSIDILVPLLGRPDQVVPLVVSISGSVQEVKLTPHFLLSPGDDDVHRAVSETRADFTVVPFEPGPGDYARKMNLGVRATSGEWVFLGARDIRFKPGWAEAALKVAEEQGKRVIGTNDLGNPLVVRGRHSTHTLIARSYIEELGTIDEPGKIVHEGYSHNWVDNELVETAQRRDEWAFAKDAIVEHLHPIWRKSTDDATYRLGQKDYRKDHALFRTRRRLWR